MAIKRHATKVIGTILTLTTLVLFARLRRLGLPAPDGFHSIDGDAGVASPDGVPTREGTTSSDPIRLVLHVGPPKTATTTIQCGLAKLEASGILSELLSANVVERESCRPMTRRGTELRLQKHKEDLRSWNISVNEGLLEDDSTLNTYRKVSEGGSFFPHCIPEWAKLNETVFVPDCWGGSYLRYIQNYHIHQKQNLFVISNEMLTTAFGEIGEPKQCHRIVEGILESLGLDAELDIVLTYRHYFEWVVSMRGQEYDGDKLGIKPRLRKWPSQGGKAIPTMEEYVASRDDVRIFVNAIECFRAASARHERVHLNVINFGAGNILSTFFAIMSRDKEITTKLINEAGAQRKNTAAGRSSEIPYDRIAVAAVSQGLLNATMFRGAARARVKRLIGEEDFEYKCPPGDFDNNVLEKSVQLWKAAFPSSDWTGERDLSKAFRTAVENKTLCDVDGESIAESQLPSLMKTNV